ncbi:hypothetical protein ILUMI_20066 [Ignelater luminosus]|uniref:Retroviral polymerase SH3-like domain-containing protein n=1 Tax=Ignelater luminosus TaxID=2038154 RepID=A0A8K0G583_IGNLU|nr:hypothetical protein ILUMI_20066 [Ignelater luminosus]
MCGRLCPVRIAPQELGEKLRTVEQRDKVEKRKKWDTKSIPGILVGYHGLRDGCRVYVPSKRRTCITHDVVFKKDRAVAEHKLTAKEVSCFEIHGEEESRA